jgi:hypothetical protein
MSVAFEQFDREGFRERRRFGTYTDPPPPGVRAARTRQLEQSEMVGILGLQRAHQNHKRR